MEDEFMSNQKATEQTKDTFYGNAESSPNIMTSLIEMLNTIPVASKDDEDKIEQALESVAYQKIKDLI